MSDNGIIVNWKSAQKPVDDKPTSQELATDGKRLGDFEDTGCQRKICSL